MCVYAAAYVLEESRALSLALSFALSRSLSPPLSLPARMHACAAHSRSLSDCARLQEVRDVFLEEEMDIEAVQMVCAAYTLNA
jgi:hypothetical protein